MSRLQLFVPKDLPALHFSRYASRKQFLTLVRENPDFRIELTAEGEIIVMAPAHSRSGERNLDLTRQLGNWAFSDRQGIAYDSSSGFDLPNGSNRSPDASWVRKLRLDALDSSQKDEYLPLCPDFVVELRSKSNTLPDLQAKMHEYMENGAQIGWLIDPFQQAVYTYRPAKPVQLLEHPATLTGDPELPGFTLDLSRIWNPQT